MNFRYSQDNNSEIMSLKGTENFRFFAKGSKRTFFIVLAAAVYTATVFCIKPVYVHSLIPTEEIEEYSILVRAFKYLSLSLDGYGLLWMVFVAGLALLYGNTLRILDKKDKKWPIAFTAALLSLCFILGRSFQSLGNWDLIFGSKYLFFQSFLCFLGYFLFFSAIILWVFRALDKMFVGCKTSLMLEKHPFLLPWLIIFVCWLPYLIAFYPGSISGDAFVQINDFFDSNGFSDHHPFFSTVLLGLCLKAGRLVSSDNVGMMLYTLLQSLAFAISLAYGIRVLLKMRTPSWFVWLCIGIYAFLPIFPGYSQYVGKDTLFTAAFVFYMVLVIELAVDRTILSTKRFWIGIFLSSLLICLLRHNGFYIWILSAPFLLFLVKAKRERIKLSGILVAALLVFEAYTRILLPFLNVSPGGVSEALSIPLQQTARYVKYHSAEITPSEKEAINRVLDYDALGDIYDPEVSDPVKGTFKDSAFADKKAYLSVWIAQFFKHPGTYFQATLANSYGYIYPDAKDIWPFGTGIFSDSHYNHGNFGFNQKAIFKQPREFLIGWKEVYVDIPGVGLLGSPGIYTWVMIVLLGFTLKNRSRMALIPLVPCFLTMLTCIASPVNRFSRYYLPVMSIIWIVIALAAFLASPERKAAEVTHKK